MKKAIIFSLSLATFVAFTACKKKKEDDPTPTTPTVQSYTKADDASARNELDRAQDDIESVYNSQDYAAARTSAINLPCGNVTLNSKNFTIQYNGVNCGTRVLSGSINVTLVSGTKFSDMDAKLKVEFVNYKVYYNASKESIIYNGITYITNSSGGTLASLFTTTPGTVIHKVRGTLTLSYDTLGTTAVDLTWNLFRKKTYTSDGTQKGITFKFEGDTIIDADTYIPGTYTAASCYGLDVNGLKFVHDIPTPFIWSNCGTTYDGPYVLKQGKVVYTADASTTALGANWIYQFSATAGYAVSGGNYVLDGTCSSSGYLIAGSVKNTSTQATFGKYSAYQQY